MVNRNKSLVLLHLQLLCASSLYSPFYPPTCHTLPLLFSNLIYYSIFCRFFTEIPQLTREAYHKPLCLGLILSLTSLFSLSDYSSVFIDLYYLVISTLAFTVSYSVSLLRTLSASIFYTCIHVVSERVCMFSSSQVCILSVIPPIQSCNPRSHRSL